MDIMTIEEFKTETNIDVILGVMKMNNGYITSEMLTDLGIGREYLRILMRKNIIKNLTRGIYIAVSNDEDKYFTFSLSYPSVILSHRSALYLHGLIEDNLNGKFDITILKPYHNPRLEKYNSFFVSDDNYELGLTWVKTSYGNYVRSYDIERSICDLIRSIHRMDNDTVTKCVKNYLNSDYKNIDKLYKYADKLGIGSKVINFMSLIDQ